MVDLKHLIRKLLIVLFCICAITILIFSYSSTPSCVLRFTDWSDKPVSRALCACRQCISVEDEDPWFMKRFNTSISPLLSQENAILSKSTYYWWQVNVFGFGAAKDGTWQHYWEKNKFTRRKPTGWHAGDYESMTLKLLACKKRKIKLFEGK